MGSRFKCERLEITLEEYCYLNMRFPVTSLVLLCGFVDHVRSSASTAQDHDMNEIVFFRRWSN